MRKSYITWVGVIAALATIGSFAYQVAQGHDSTPKKSIIQTIASFTGFNFGNVEQHVQYVNTVEKEEPPIVVKRDPVVSHDQRMNIIELKNIINDLSEVQDCGQPSPMLGSIVNREYDPKNKVRLIGIVLKTTSGERGFLNIDATLYDRLPRADQAHLDEFLAEGKHVKLMAYMCGQGNGVWYIDAISPQ